jgi:hypothetical protein
MTSPVEHSIATALRALPILVRMLPDLIGNRGVESARSLSHRELGHLAEILAAAIASVLVYVHPNVPSTESAQSVEPCFDA